MLNRIITFCIFSTLFFSSFVLFKQPFEFYLPYIFIFSLLPFFIFKFPFPVFIFKIFGPLLLWGLISIWTRDNTSALFWKIYLNILFSAMFYYYVFEAYKFDLNKLFSYYLKGAFILSVIGLIQFVSYKLGFEYGYNFRLYGLNKWNVVYGGSFGIRINSLFSEPSYYGAAIGPAFFVSLFNIFTRNRDGLLSFGQSVLVIVVYFLTFSSVSYLGVFISLVLILLNLGFVRYVLIFTPIIIGGYFYLYNNVEEFKVRVDGLDELYQGDQRAFGKVHGSSFVQYNNFHVAVENFKKNPVMGSGLGSHSIAYKKYSLAKQFGVADEFNKSDANSMFLRIVSETGLFGIFFILFFIIKFFVLKNNDTLGDNLWLISNACLVIIFLQLFRQGNYTYNGFMFYMWMYYFAKQALVEKKEIDEAPTN